MLPSAVLVSTLRSSQRRRHARLLLYFTCIVGSCWWGIFNILSLTCSLKSFRLCFSSSFFLHLRVAFWVCLIMLVINIAFLCVSVVCGGGSLPPPPLLCLVFILFPFFFLSFHYFWWCGFLTLLFPGWLFYSPSVIHQILSNIQLNSLSSLRGISSVVITIASLCFNFAFHFQACFFSFLCSSSPL